MSIRRKSIIRLSNKDLETNISFWKFIKPFPTNKGTLTDCDITIIDGTRVILNDFELAKTFNNHYINTVEIKGGFKPLKITNKSNDDFSVIKEIIRTYQNHPSAKQINSSITTSSTPKPISFRSEPTNPFRFQERLKGISSKTGAFDKIPHK